MNPFFRILAKILGLYLPHFAEHFWVWVTLWAQPTKGQREKNCSQVALHSRNLSSSNWTIRFPSLRDLTPVSFFYWSLRPPEGNSLEGKVEENGKREKAVKGEIAMFSLNVRSSSSCSSSHT